MSIFIISGSPDFVLCTAYYLISFSYCDATLLPSNFYIIL